MKRWNTVVSFDLYEGRGRSASFGELEPGRKQDVFCVTRSGLHSRLGTNHMEAKWFVLKTGLYYRKDYAVVGLAGSSSSFEAKSHGRGAPSLKSCPVLLEYHFGLHTQVFHDKPM